MNMYKFPSKENFLKVFLCFLMGIIAYCIYQEWIIITIDYAMHGKRSKILTPKKRELICFFNNADQWYTEVTEIIWSNNQIDNLYTVVEQWITLGQTEGFLEKKIRLQAATVSPDKKIAYLSFNQSCLDKEQGIYQKLMVIEGLLKTIKEQNPTLTHVCFLKNHQSLVDVHLDFTNPWPVDGFSKQKND